MAVPAGGGTGVNTSERCGRTALARLFAEARHSYGRWPRRGLPNRASLRAVGNGMSVFLRRLGARVPAWWLPIVLAAAVAACQQKGNGPGY
jgi:hypothetical protein